MADMNKQALLDYLGQFKIPNEEGIFSGLGVDVHVQTNDENVRLIFSGDLRAVEKISKCQSDLKEYLSSIVEPANLQFVFSGQTESKQKQTPTGSAPQKLSLPFVKNIIAVASGKGGVGKSTVAVNLACALKDAGHRVGLLDLDIYGPSVPTMLGIQQEPEKEGNKVIPIFYKGMATLSIGYLIPADKAVIWRGPLIQKMVYQFLMETKWPELDYLILDTPPGTGDVHLSLAQIVPLSGVLVVTTPQKLSLIDAEKSIAMYETLKIPVLGLIENMANVKCPKCDHSFQVFDEGGGVSLSRKKQVPLLASLPINSIIRESGDIGTPFYVKNRENLASQKIGDVAKYLEKVFK